jgi:hypothetical protein
MIARLAETLQRDFTLAEPLRLEDFFGALWDEMDGAAMLFADRCGAPSALARCSIPADRPTRAGGQLAKATGILAALSASVNTALSNLLPDWSCRDPWKRCRSNCSACLGWAVLVDPPQRFHTQIRAAPSATI